MISSPRFSYPGHAIPPDTPAPIYSPDAASLWCAAKGAWRTYPSIASSINPVSITPRPARTDNRRERQPNSTNVHHSAA